MRVMNRNRPSVDNISNISNRDDFVFSLLSGMTCAFLHESPENSRAGRVDAHPCLSGLYGMGGKVLFLGV